MFPFDTFGPPSQEICFYLHSASLINKELQKM